MTRSWEARLGSVAAFILAGCHTAGHSSRTSSDARPDSTLAALRAESTIAAPIVPVAVCESVAVLWRATGHATVVVTDTVARVQTTDSVDRNQGRYFTNVRGCATSANASKGLDSAQHAMLYWKASAERGWADFPQLDADGPDGNARTRQRAGIWCQIEQSYDGGDDSDSTYVPSPRFLEVTICWRAVS